MDMVFRSLGLLDSSDYRGYYTVFQPARGNKSALSIAAKRSLFISR